MPFASLELEPRQPVELVAHLIEDGQPVETIPGVAVVRFHVPDESYAASMWSV